jgi:protein-S-isoprenylcysteine O-methyltransferase Ste14
MIMLDIVLGLIALTLMIAMVVTQFMTSYKNKKKAQSKTKTTWKDIALIIVIIVAVTSNLYLCYKFTYSFFYKHITHSFIILGIAFAFHFFALKQLNTNWADSSTPNTNAELITSGVYSIVRHPIYSSFFFEGIGFILASPYLLAVGIVAMYIPVSRLMVDKEEDKLIDFYGEEYKEYMKKCKYKIIPFIF